MVPKHLRLSKSERLYCKEQPIRERQIVYREQLTLPLSSLPLYLRSLLLTPLSPQTELISLSPLALAVSLGSIVCDQRRGEQTPTSSAWRVGIIRKSQAVIQLLWHVAILGSSNWIKFIIKRLVLGWGLCITKWTFRMCAAGPPRTLGVKPSEWLCLLNYCFGIHQGVLFS